jgi:hypothetical protein
MARKVERMTGSSRELFNNAKATPFLLDLGINNQGAFASAMAHLTGGDDWDMGLEGAIDKPFDAAMSWEVSGFVRGSW